MKEQDTLHARHYATGEPISVSVEAGRITRITPAHAGVPEDLWIAPPLLDLQINGFAGVDFQRDQIPLPQLEHAARSIEREGCARFFLTLITDAWPVLMRRLARLRQLRSQSDLLRRAIAGWHLEGPFLSDQPGYSGAHNSAVMEDPALDKIRELRAVTENDPVLLTLAPERKGSLDAIREAVRLGMRINLGHTNADAATLAAAVRAGATGFTHLGNGCPAELNRHDNILWRVLETPGLFISLIPDQIHVSPTLFRLLHKLLPGDRIYYITDAVAAAGAPSGRYTLGQLEVEVGEDRIVRKPGSRLFAGAALTPREAITRTATMLNCNWRQAWARMSDIPAAHANLSPLLRPGEPATFCLLQGGAEAKTCPPLKLLVEGENITP